MILNAILAVVTIVSMAVATLCFLRSKQKLAMVIGTVIAVIPAVLLVGIVLRDGGIRNMPAGSGIAIRTSKSAEDAPPAPTAQPGWSLWMVEEDLPDGITPDSKGVESRVEYACKTLEKAISNSKSEYIEADGWTLYDTITVEAGTWSDWSATEATESDTQAVEIAAQYRYQDAEYTTSTESVLNGWTQTGATTQPGAWSAWSDWSTTPASNSDTMNVVTQEYQPKKTQYAYVAYSGICIVRNCSAHGYGNRCYTTSKSHANKCFRSCETSKKWSDTNSKSTMGFTSFEGGKHNHALTSETQTVPDGTPITQYKYQTRTMTTIYSYTKVGTWSTWSFSKPAEASNRKIETRNVYKVCPLSATYYFERWSELSAFSEVPIAADDITSVETREVYRYPLP